MLEKIEKYQPWLVVVLIGMILSMLLVLLMELTGGHSWAEKFIYIFALPAFQMLEISIISSIREFSGDILEAEIVFQNTVTAGLSLLIIFIIMPFLLIKGYLTTDNTSNEKRGVIWYVGAFLYLITVGITANNVLGNTILYFNGVNSANNNSIANSSDTDELRYELVKLALDASTLNTLPSELGGGNGTFTQFENENGELVPIQLEQLESYNSNLPFEFIIHPKIGDSTITIVGISEFEGRNEDFINLNGAVGKKQLSVEVHPYGEDIFHIDRDSLFN